MQKVLTGYPSQDNPQSKNSTFFEKHPIIPNTSIYTTIKLLSRFYLEKNIDGKEYYNTGTLGYIDEDGYFTPTGRNSRFYIMSSLNKVYCDNVQSIISSFDCVRDCAVVKVPDQEELYVNKAYIVLNDGYFPDEDTLGHIKDLFYIPTTVSNGRKTQLKTYEIPSYVEFVDSLPRIPGTEKIDYPSLEKYAELKLTTGNKVKVK